MSISSVGRGAWQVLLTLLARLRFVAILAAIGLVIVNWDRLAMEFAKWTRPAGAPSSADSDSEYFCPMHPAIVRDTGKDKCPICFMPLSKRKKGETSDAPLPAGVVNRVQLSPYRIVLAGVRTEPVAFIALTKEITTVGTVEFDERGLKRVAARVKGRIDKLALNQTGQMVHKGDELATLYSPDLVVTAQNLIDARRTENKELERIARERLSLWGLEADQIEQIAKSGKAATQITVRSPIDGHVIKRYQTEGSYVEEGTPLYDVGDLETVWVQAQVYEDDLGFLPAASHDLAAKDRIPVAMTTRAWPGETFAGALSFVLPHVDPASRTLSVRVELANRDGRLKPGMTVALTMKIPPEKLAKRLKPDAGKMLAVPESAVIDTGAVKLVYRESSPGEFDGVRVELGARLGGPDGGVYFPVLAGLEPGERIVAAGAFLIDAETRLNPAVGSIYFGGGGTKAASTVRPSTPADLDARIAMELAKLSPDDRALAAAQSTCPILDGSRLGSMGVPVKILLDGKPVFLCCANCEPKARANAQQTLTKVEALKRGVKAKAKETLSPEDEAEIRAELARLPAADKALAEAQRYCPVTDERLGSMGVPVKYLVEGKPVFVCCASCDKKFQANPAAMLAKAEAFKKGQRP